MLFLMVEKFSKDGFKIGYFPTEFIKKIIFRKNVGKIAQNFRGNPTPLVQHKIWLCARGNPPPFVQQLVWGDSPALDRQTCLTL